MKKLTFATTNKGKLSEAESILGTAVQGLGLDIDEVQSLDPAQVAVKKAQEYYKHIKKPLFVEDTSLRFHALGKLPGTLIDFFLEELGNEGLTNLLKSQKNRNATAEVHVVYIYEKNKFEIFRGHTRGRIADKPKGTKGFGWDPIFIPGRQDRTFGEMNLEEKNKYSMRKRALLEFKKFLKLA